ncbi:MAG TPA: L,D-transpeptidase [Kaistia sp.]|nr:L,D-transpeptidase [Kaistia sp.]
MKMNPSILLLSALLALSSGDAVAQDYDAQHGYRYRDYAEPSYGYRDVYPQIEAAPQPYEGQPEAGTYQLQQPYQPYGPNQALQQPAPSAPPADGPPIAANPPAAVVPALVPATFIAQANEAILPDSLKRTGKQAIPAIARLQILLDRANVSPGVIDGMSGGNLAKAVSALENMNGMPSTGRMGPQIDAILASFGNRPVLVPYVITAADAAGPFVPTIPKDYGEMAQLPRLAYRNAGEALAERFHMDEGFLRRLNPGAGFTEGETITVADVGPPAKTKVYHLVADSAARQLLGYDQQWNLVVAYPATIGSTDMPSPSGIHAVKAIAIDPVYWYRPKVNFQQGKNDKALKLAPGPNNPVGSVWIGLDKPTYGIHGTPEPSRIDKTNSHGCLRLTNWDANELAHLVRPGVDVEFVDPTRTASVAPAAPPAIAPAEQPMPPPLAQ